MPVLIGMPVFGQHEYTHAIIGDLKREGADFVIIDNRGDYPRIGNERVITPGTNLGWAGGSDLGFRIAFSEGYSHAMTLNNDTRLSKGFVTGLLDARLPADAGIVGPILDYGFPSAEDHDKPAAEDYVPRPVYRTVGLAEGTALMLSRTCWQAIGGLDLHSFGRYGWGVDLDLALRARAAGFGVYLTEMAYINHFGRGTAKVRFGRLRYLAGANARMEWSMARMYGPTWRRRFPPGSLPSNTGNKAIGYTTHPLED